MAGARGNRVFAWFYERATGDADRGWQAEHREALCASAEGLVLEIGAGTGANLLHYRRARRVVAIEPDAHMLRRAAERARRTAMPVDLLAASADALPFPGATFDTIVLSLVLCSVPDLPGAVREVRRALKPGGSLRLYEHVRSTNSSTARWQDRLERPWGFFSGGCHPNRDSVGALEAEGFQVRVRPIAVPVFPSRLTPHVMGEGRAV